MCVCVFVYVLRVYVWRNPGGVSILTCKSFDTLGEGRRKTKPNHITAGSLQRFPPDNWSLTASSGKVNDWENREHVVLNLTPHTPHTHHNTRHNNNNTEHHTKTQPETDRKKTEKEASDVFVLFIPDLTSVCDPELVTSFFFFSIGDPCTHLDTLSSHRFPMIFSKGHDHSCPEGQMSSTCRIHLR